MNTTEKEISKLLRKADNFREKYETVCSEILIKLNEIADYGDLEVFIHYHNSDGYVLGFQDAEFNHDLVNVPVKGVLEVHRKLKRKITTKELLTIV